MNPIKICLLIVALYGALLAPRSAQAISPAGGFGIGVGVVAGLALISHYARASRCACSHHHRHHCHHHHPRCSTCADAERYE